jgi:hypothetical protein
MAGTLFIKKVWQIKKFLNLIDLLNLTAQHKNENIVINLEIKSTPDEQDLHPITCSNGQVDNRCCK